MGRKIHKPEELVAKLRQVDVLTAQGQSIADAIRSIGVTEVTYYRWRQEYGGLKSDQVKQPKRGRLWLADGSCLRLRPQHKNHVWSYDFIEDRTHDKRRYRMLNVIDEFTHECLAIRVARRLKAIDVIDLLSDLFLCAVCRDTFARTMGQSSSPRRCRAGSPRSVPTPPTSRPAALGERIRGKLQCSPA